MITVSLLGMDYYQAIEVTKRIHSRLVEIYRCKDEDLVFFAPESFLIHDGIEQTSFRLNIRVEAPDMYADREREVKDVLFDALKDVAIHFRVLFTYFEPEHEYLKIDDIYPEYMTDKNVVKAEDEHDHDHEEEDDDSYSEEYEEPYMGDIIGEFDTYIQQHPDATNDEIYKALTEIREKVTEKHHANGDDGKEEE